MERGEAPIFRLQDVSYATTTAFDPENQYFVSKRPPYRHWHFDVFKEIAFPPVELTPFVIFQRSETGFSRHGTESRASRTMGALRWKSIYPRCSYQISLLAPESLRCGAFSDSVRCCRCYPIYLPPYHFPAVGDWVF